MSGKKVRIRELAGWDLDAYEYRPESLNLDGWFGARGLVAQRPPFQTSDAILEKETVALQDAFSVHASRPDLDAEMNGLSWSLGVVDLRLLLAFQRRLSFNPALPPITAPTQENWPGLMALSFGPPRPIVFDLIFDPMRDPIRDTSACTFVLQSTNPDLHLRFSKDLSNPVTLHGGSPFLEVGHYRGRWFLRDGYHRAYALLKAGVHKVPAVIVKARTLEGLLGTAHPWFFSEEILFSSNPPHVIDFLDDAITIEYDRPQLIKTIRVSIEETRAPEVLSK
jgi:hypothetical protein